MPATMGGLSVKMEWKSMHMTFLHRPDYLGNFSDATKFMVENWAQIAPGTVLMGDDL